MPDLLKPKSVEMLARLWGVYHDTFPDDAVPPAGRVTVPAKRDVLDAFYYAIGYVRLAGQIIRADMTERLAAVGVTFDERYLEVKGILFQLMEEIALQDINVIEIASTATEFSVFLHEDDVQLAFDAIFNRFSRRR